MSDIAKVVAFILFIALCVGTGIYLHFLAPCSQVGWLPLKDQPGRCVTIVVHQ